MQVLAALARAEGGVVLRDQLVEGCWEGRIVGDDAVNRYVVTLRKLVRELDPPPFEIETIARVGYVLTPNPATRTADAASVPARRPRSTIAIAAILLAGLLGFGALFLTREAPPRPRPGSASPKSARCRPACPPPPPTASASSSRPSRSRTSFNWCRSRSRRRRAPTSRTAAASSAPAPGCGSRCNWATSAAAPFINEGRARALIFTGRDDEGWALLRDTRALCVRFLRTGGRAAALRYAVARASSA